MRIAIIGAGYVGLINAGCLAEAGHDVICCDSDDAKIAALTRGEVPIFEPGLSGMLVANMRAGRLAFTSDIARAAERAEAAIIAVGTPALPSGEADLSQVRAAVSAIAQVAQGPMLIILRSTVPVGTGDQIEGMLSEVRPQHALSVVSSPEFLREGKGIADFQNPDRVVIGTDDADARKQMRALYAGYRAEVLVFTDRRSAELLKYASNAFLAMKVTYINEVADLCERTGANVREVAAAMGMDPRIGPEFLRAGPGYGGSCFPKDTLAFVNTAKTFGSQLRLVETVIAVNQQRAMGMVDKIVRACGGSVRGVRIGVLGLTFKADTDDMRDAPSIAIIRGLMDAGATVCGYDPQGMPAATKLLPELQTAADAYDAAEGAEAIVLLTDWEEFKHLDFVRLAKAMRGNAFIDLRNFFDGPELKEHGLKYFAVG